MRLSTKGEYGVRAIFDLALHYGQGYVQKAEIASRQGVSDLYLVQLLTLLRKAGYVHSVRGPKGGHRLTRSPEEITLGEIVRLLEGSTDPIDCVGSEGANCAFSGQCVLQEVWGEVKSAVDQILFSTTFGDLCRRKQKRDKAITFRI